MKNHTRAAAASALALGLTVVPASFALADDQDVARVGGVDDLMDTVILDENGNPIALDEDGNPVDENGDPLEIEEPDQPEDPGENPDQPDNNENPVEDGNGGAGGGDQGAGDGGWGPSPDVVPEYPVVNEQPVGGEYPGDTAASQQLANTGSGAGMLPAIAGGIATILGAALVMGRRLLRLPGAAK